MLDPPDAPDAPEVTMIRFPPIPAVPDGVNIIPFKDFIECGIQSSNHDQEVELDGRGIPTIELRAQKGADAGGKRKRKKTANIPVETGFKNGLPVRKEWWQAWEEGEQFRVFHYDPHLSRVDRLLNASTDFRSRPWPSNAIGAQNLWDQFRLFTGLLSSTPNLGKTKGQGEPEGDDDISDDDSEIEHPHVSALSTDTKQAENDDVDMDDKGDDRINAFLNDPETSIKIFLSSFMIKQGLIWSDRNLPAVPRIVSFFIEFLLRNRALPEPTHERELRRALAIAKIAINDLPLTSKLAKTIPDEFHLSCRGCWSPKSESYITLGPILTEEVQPDDERDPKRQKVDSGDDQATADPFETELRAANVQVIPPGAGVDLTKEVIEDNLDGKHWATGAWSGGWGADGGDGGWGADASGGWGGSSDAPADNNGGSFDPTDASAWAPTLHSLIPLLGPTTFPITHTTGIVEVSLRRIKSFTLPPSTATTIPKPTGAGGVANPDAVEATLESQFVKVVFEPWLDWDPSDTGTYAKPRILPSSKGPVVTDDDNGTVKGEKPHDPFKDDITVLVLPSVVETLSVGLGVGATWVQIVHQTPEKGDGLAAAEGSTKKKKGKAKKVRDRFWYVDELTMTLPSFYVPLPAA